MSYRKFDPRGEKAPEASLVPRKVTSPLMITLQLLGVFVLLRSVMLILGMPFFRIPIFDAILVKIILLFYRP